MSQTCGSVGPPFAGTVGFGPIKALETGGGGVLKSGAGRSGKTMLMLLCGRELVGSDMVICRC